MPRHPSNRESQNPPASQSARSGLEAYLHQQWQKRGVLACLLWPLALLHGLLVGLRSLAYSRGWLKSQRAPVPVLVVGNIVVGGAGKTPLLIALLEGLRAAGWNPGVVSRGYGAQPLSKDEPPRIGHGQLAPELFGDEPTLITARTGATVAVHPQRAWAAQALCVHDPSIDLILSDDGLQHLALHRDLEVVVQDARGVGNGWLLPAGPLREPPRRLRRVDAIVSNLGSLSKPPDDAKLRAPLPPSAAAVRHCTMQLLPEAAVRLMDGQRATLAELAQQHPSARIVALAGIGQPERFFQTLRVAGLQPRACIALPDHHAFEKDLFSELDADLILLTDKDAVKCQASPDPRLWRVPVSAGFSDPEFVAWLSQQLRQTVRTATSSNTTSRHGSSSA